MNEFPVFITSNVRSGGRVPARICMEMGVEGDGAVHSGGTMENPGMMPLFQDLVVAYYCNQPWGPFKARWDQGIINTFGEDAELPWFVKDSRIMLVLPMLQIFQPDMRVIYVYRNAEDFTWKSKDMTRKNNPFMLRYKDEGEFDFAAHFWKITNTAARSYLETFMEGRYLEFSLEGMCERPRETVESIAEFVGYEGDVGKIGTWIKRPETVGICGNIPQSTRAILE